MSAAGDRTTPQLSSARRVLIATTRSVALYAFAAWVYVALVALIEPDTLHLRLTHLASWPRTDTFGEISFAVSFIAFWLYTFLRPPEPSRVRRGGDSGGA